MDIQHSSHRKLFKAKHRDTAFYHLFEADEDLVSELVSFINTLFAPLTWILEETLYRRVQKQDKGWIKIDFLHRNKRLQSIFSKFEIPSHCRRRKKFLNKAIQKSVIKRKRNLIKRREYMNINQQAKKVIYIEQKNIQPGDRNIKTDEMRNLMIRKNLINLIGVSVRQILTMRGEQQNPDKMQIQGQQIDKTRLFDKFMSEIVFEGSLLKNRLEDQQNPSHQNKENIEDEITYRWCFIYFPSINQHQVKKILLDLQNFVSYNQGSVKIQLEEEMCNLQISERNLNESSKSINENNIKIHMLTEILSQYYPKYNEVCQEIGYTHVNYRKQALKVKQKQREKQKVRLLESRYLDDKIDLVNKYHLKLDIEKQKRAYWERRNKQIQERIRKRQQKRRNRMNRNEEPQKKKNLTEKLKELFNIDQPRKPEKKLLLFESKPEFLNSNTMNTEYIPENYCIVQSQHDEEVKAPGIKIKIPKFQHGDLPRQSSQNSQSQKKIQKEEKKVHNVNLDEFEEDQINYQYDSLMSSGEEFEIPKKKKRNRNSQSSKKNKKIVKQTDHKGSKNPNGKSQVYRNSKSHSNNQPSGSRQSSSRNLSNSNGTYNLRHKSPSQGSYLKMAGYVYEQEPVKKAGDQIYEDNDDEEKREQTNGRSIRLRKRNEYYD